MKKGRPYTLVLLSSSFPYGNGESFLETELPYLRNFFEKVIILPLSKSKNDKKRNTPGGVFILPPLVQGRNLIAKLVFLTHALLTINNIFSLFLKSIRSPGYPNTIHNLKASMITSMIGSVAFQKLKPYMAETRTLLYSYWGNNLAAAFILLSEEIPKVCRFHGIDLYANRSCHKGFIPLQHKIVLAADHLYFISEHGLKYGQSCYPSESYKMHVCHLGVRSSPICSQSQDGVFRIVTCSSLIPVKRISVLVEALFLCHEVRINWTHIGVGSEYNHINKKSKDLPCNISTNLLGQLTNEEVSAYYAKNAVDLFINISETEGIPVSIMEAMSAGIPVLAGNVGGISEIVTSKIGWLIEPVPDALTISKEITRISKISKNLIQRRRLNARAEWKEKWNAERNFSAFGENLFRIIREMQSSSKKSR